MGRKKGATETSIPGRPDSRAMRSIRRARRIALGALAVVLVSAAFGLAPSATAQVPNVNCLSCAVELSVVEWNGTGAPGTFVGGTLRVENTGESTDSYTITVTPSAPDWVADSDLTVTGDVAPGAGLLAEDDNFVEFAVIVLVPETAAAGAEAGVTVVVTSENDEGVTATTSTVAGATQVYAWTLVCTPNLSIAKTGSGVITLEATNNGNGGDSAVVQTIGVNGLSIPEPEAVSAGADETDTQDLDVGVGLRLEDGDYTLRWNLTSTKSTSTHAACTTVITVTGGTPTDADEGDADADAKDSPAVPLLLPLLAAAGLAQRARRREGST